MLAALLLVAYLPEPSLGLPRALLTDRDSARVSGVRPGSARGEGVVAAVLACFGVGVLALSSGLPAATTADPVGPRGFPSLLGLVLLACGVALWFGSRAGSPVEEAPEHGRLAPGSLLGAIACTALYLAVLEPAGYLLATPPYLAALLLLQGRVTARAFVLTVLGLPAALYALFAVAMRVPLPAGPLEPLLRGF